MIRQRERLHDVYHHPEHGWRSVKRGFSWLAFLAPSVWAVLRQLRGVTTLMIVLTTAAFELASVAGQLAPNPVSQVVILSALLILLGLKPGFEGWQWCNQALEADGFEHRSTVLARSARAAIRAVADHPHRQAGWLPGAA